MDGPIEEDVPKDQLRQEPYALPKDFEWFLVDINDENEVGMCVSERGGGGGGERGGTILTRSLSTLTQMKDLYELLTFNYVEDDDAQFRFDYSAEFLKWLVGL